MLLLPRVIIMKNTNFEAKALCRRIQLLIDENHSSYGKVAEMTGIPKSAIHRYATGITQKIPMDRVEAIADAFQVSAAYLMGWSDNPKAQKVPPELDGKIARVVEIMQDLTDEELDKVLDYVQLLTLRRGQ